MKNKIVIISVLLIFALTSCKDFLNEVPKHNWAIENAMDSHEKAVQAINGIYARIAPGDALNMELSAYLVSASGLIWINNAYSMDFMEANTPSGPWNTAYSGINSANLAVNGIPLIADSSFPSLTVKNELLGEARFMRGYLHSKILLHYCRWYDPDDSPYGILRRDETSDVKNAYLSRITVGESWKFILEDIDAGIDNMAGFSTPRRASKEFAKAYKARLLLYRGHINNNMADLNEAKNLVTDVLNNLPSALRMEPDMANMYAKAWDNTENLFVRYLENNGNRTANAGWNCTNGPVVQTANTNRVSVVPYEDATCGLRYGLDIVKNDPRWTVVTGAARQPDMGNDYESWAFTKVYRKGNYAGMNATPRDENYAVYHMRLPELYIMQAELIARTGGSSAEAIAPINTMRAKRTHPVLPPVPVPVSAQDLMDAIFWEWICELIYENGSEFYASIRFEKNGKKQMELAREAYGIADFSFADRKDWLQFPIPGGEMNNNYHLYLTEEDEDGKLVVITDMQNPRQK